MAYSESSFPNQVFAEHGSGAISDPFLSYIQVEQQVMRQRYDSERKVPLQSVVQTMLSELGIHRPTYIGHMKLQPSPDQSFVHNALVWQFDKLDTDRNQTLQTSVSLASNDFEMTQALAYISRGMNAFDEGETPDRILGIKRTGIPGRRKFGRQMVFTRALQTMLENPDYIDAMTTVKDLGEGEEMVRDRATIPLREFLRSTERLFYCQPENAHYVTPDVCMGAMEGGITRAPVASPTQSDIAEYLHYRLTQALDPKFLIYRSGKDPEFRQLDEDMQTLDKITLLVGASTPVASQIEL